MNMISKRNIVSSVKVLVAATTVAAIGFSIVSQDVAEPLKTPEAQADIVWGQAGDDGHNFTRAVASLGLEPRPYDFNGNVMYFAAGKFDRTPAQMEDMIQRALVEQGVNKQRHDEVMQGMLAPAKYQTKEDAAKMGALAQPAAESIVDGEVVPVFRSREYVAFAGNKFNGGSDKMIDRFQTGEITSKGDIDAYIDGYQFIDATFDAASGMTDVTAVWSGEGYDAKKMDNTAFKQQEADPNVPACIGCKRDFRMQSLAKDEPVRANKWHTMGNPRVSYDFYKQSMLARGWRETGAQAKIDKIAEVIPEVRELGGYMLNLEKDDKTMQIVMLDDGMGGTQIISHERYEGAQNTSK